jgi:molybdopterin-guanine dinucleotide biosynthesis protein B
MRVIGIIGYKKSGKTTLTLKLSDELKKRGYKVAVVKHTNKDLDLANSDTSKYKEGLTQVAAITPEESVIFLKHKKNLEEIIKYFEADIILIEGFKREKTFPKIVCLREESEKAELFDGLQLCTAGFVSKELNPKLCDFNILNDGDIKKIANIVIEKSFKLPNLNCGECGYRDCYGLAQEIVKGRTFNLSESKWEGSPDEFLYS